MILIIIIQFPRKHKYFPLGTQILKKVKNGRDILQDQNEWGYQQILYWDKITLSMERQNNTAILGIRVIDILFITAIILISVLFTYVLRGM